MTADAGRLIAADIDNTTPIVKPNRAEQRIRHISTGILRTGFTQTALPFIKSVPQRLHFIDAALAGRKTVTLKAPRDNSLLPRRVFSCANGEVDPCSCPGIALRL
jgi:hypothetical protein